MTGGWAVVGVAAVGLVGHSVGCLVRLGVGRRLAITGNLSMRQLSHCLVLHELREATIAGNPDTVLRGSGRRSG